MIMMIVQNAAKNVARGPKIAAIAWTKHSRSIRSRITRNSTVRSQIGYQRAAAEIAIPLYGVFPPNADGPHSQPTRVVQRDGFNHVRRDSEACAAVQLYRCGS